MKLGQRLCLARSLCISLSFFVSVSLFVSLSLLLSLSLSLSLSLYSERTHDPKKHTPLVPTSLHGATQADGQSLHGGVLKLVQALHLLLISHCFISDVDQLREKGGVVTVWPRARTLWATAAARRSG